MTAVCCRCGVRREVNECRPVNDLCLDCRLVERDLAAMHGSNAGYSRHIRQQTIPCNDCLTAHRAAMTAWRQRQGRGQFQPSRCSTNGGYYAHKRRGEEPCDDCRQAQAEYQRTYYATVRRPRREKAA